MDDIVMHFFEALESTGVAVFIRESPSLLAYTFVLSLHAMGLAVVIGLSTLIALRLLGVNKAMPLAPLQQVFPFMYVGFWVNAISGLGLFAANATGMGTNPLFYVKIVFIVGGVLVMRLLRNRVFDGRSLDAGVPDGARKLAIASLACWGIALVAGRLTAYPYLIGYYLGI